MNHSSNNKNKTLVKALSTTLFFVFAFSPLTGWGANNTTSDGSDYSNAYTPGDCPKEYPNDIKACQTAVRARQQEDKNARTCDNATKAVSSAKKEIGDACKKAGVGDEKSCLNQALACGKVTSEDVFSSTEEAGKAADAEANTEEDPKESNSGLNKACPQLSGRDYFTDRDKVTKDIKSTKDDIAKLVEDKAKAQDEYNKTIQDLQEDLNKAQEELNNKKLELKDKKRKMLTDFQNQQKQMKEELRKQGNLALNLRGQIMTSQQDQAVKLIAMSDASGKRACLKAVADARKAYDAVATADNGSYIGQAKSKRQDLINIFNDCMSTFNQQRNALNKAKKQEQDQLNQALNDSQQSVDEINNSLNSAQSQLTEMQTDAQTEEDNATQKVLKLMQANQTKMMAAQQKLQSTLQAIGTKDQALQEQLKRQNTSLTSLGAVPKVTKSELSVREASSIISTQVGIVLGIMGAPGTQGCFQNGYEKTKVLYKNYDSGKATK